MAESLPSFDIADREAVAGMIRLVLTKWLQGTDDMLPARVLSYDRATNRAKVQPMIVLRLTGGKKTKEREPIASVPVFQYGAGNIVISCPVKAGDIGWIKAADRDCSNFKKAYKMSTPNTLRLHKFSDGLFIPDTMLYQFVISEEDIANDALVISNKAGTNKLSVWQNIFKMITEGFGIGITPNAHAIFHVASTTKASIPWPKMTTTQRDAIPSPIEGMAIWNITTHGINTYNGSTWG